MKGDKQYSKTKSHFFKSLDLNDVITPEDPADATFTGTKLIGTLGPSCHDADTLAAMLDAGMSAARIDLTWGPLEFHCKSLEALNVATTNRKKLCAVIIDTLGREVMVKRPYTIGDDGWTSHGSPVHVAAGQIVTLTTRDDVEATDDIWPVTYPNLHAMAETGDTIYVGRYLVCGADSASLYLNVVDVKGQNIICQATNSADMDGLMTVFHMERSSDALVNLQNNLPLFSDYDRQAIEVLGREFEIDFLLVTYTRTGEDIREARAFLDSLGMTSTRVLAKVETRQSLLSYRGILAHADGVVISRGNLGLDILPEKMAVVQKQLISACNLLGKPVVITRVCDSMVTNPRPTRAEATDVANAVLDGVDAFLLGAETLRGSYPVDVVKTIARICRVAERVFDHQFHYDHLMESAIDLEASLGPRGKSSDSLDAAAHDHTANGVSPATSSTDLTANKEAFGAVAQEIHAFTACGGAGSVSNYSIADMRKTSQPGPTAGVPYLSKLESIASSAVRAAGMVEADLIVVYTNTGRTANLVAKYRPPMPIVTLVVPHLVSDGIRWKLEGRTTARCCQLTRGLLPMLATPGKWQFS
eukprot:jgi/Chrzof1/4470/Cz14g14130.t1_PYK3[v5.2]